MTDSTAKLSTRRMPDLPGFVAAPHPAPAADLHTAADAPRAPRVLQRCGTVLLVSVLFAQAVFLGYLLASYGRTALAGNVAAWARFSYKGWVPGDLAGNASMLLHVGVAVVMLLAGAVQVSPALRRRMPALHRWSGRVYLVGGGLGAASGLALVWGRGTVGDLSQHVAISINALLLVGCAALAWRTARARTFGAHRVWALRTFVVANGVLYFRLFLALWLLVFRAPVGFDPRTFSGPFLTALAITVYVVGPLLVLEAFIRAERSARPIMRTLTAGLLGGLSALVLAGTGAAVMVLWLPRFR